MLSQIPLPYPLLCGGTGSAGPGRETTDAGLARKLAGIGVSVLWMWAKYHSSVCWRYKWQGVYSYSWQDDYSNNPSQVSLCDRDGMLKVKDIPVWDLFFSLE